MGLSAIVGQERLVKELVETAKRGAVANTYMFVGPEGCGKIALALSLSLIHISEPTRPY